MSERFSPAQMAVVDRDNRNMAAAGYPMSTELNDVWDAIDTGNIGITADAKDVDSIALGGGAFGYDASTSLGLNFGYRAGRVQVGQTFKSVAASTILLAASNTNYVEVDPTGSGSVAANTSGWTSGRVPLYIVVTGPSSISTVTQAKVFLVGTPNGAITGVMLSTAAATKSINKGAGASVAATTEILIIALPFAATLTGVSFVNSTAVAGDDTNYWTFALVNAGSGGGGSTPMLDTGAVNTTKATGGSALVAKSRRALALNGTSGNLNTAAGDTLVCTLTKTASATTLTETEFQFNFSFAV